MPIAFCSIYAWSRQKKNDIVMALAKSLLWFELFVVLFANVCSIGHSLNRWSALLCWMFVIILFTLLGGKLFPDGVRGYWKQLGRDLKVEITTGLEALGRGNDATKLRQFIADLAATNNPQVLGYLNLPDFIKRIGAARGIDMNGLVKTAEEVAQEQQEARNQQMMQQVVGSASGVLPDLIKGAVGQTGESQQ